MKPLPAADLSGQTRGGNHVERKRSRRTRKSTTRRRYVCGNRKCRRDHGGDPPDRCECGSTKIVGQWLRFEVRVEAAERERWIFCAGREGYLSVSDWIRDTCNGRVRARVLTSSDVQSHNTPREILDVLKPLGRIALDPCSNATSIVRARQAWTVADDGLARAWMVDGLVYVNPPYGDELPIWIRKCSEEAARGAEIVMLVPARSDTQWFGFAAEVADVALWKGRIKYGGNRHPAPFPICLIYFGPRPALFAKAVEKKCVRVLSAVTPAWRRRPSIEPAKVLRKRAA